VVEGIACHTGLVLELRERWDEFDAVQRTRMTAKLAPWKLDLDDEIPSTPAADGGRATDTCWGQYGANRIVGDHFSVEWDDGVAENTASKFLDALEHAWEVEVEELGWRAPDGSDDYLIMAYIDESSYGGAYASVEMCNGKYVPYIVAGSGSFGGGSFWYMDMAAHEFNHTMQFGYGYAHEFWWWEATATYIEEQVYPDHNEWASYVPGYTEVPYIAMTASDQQNQTIFYHMYGMCIMGFHLDNHVADYD